MRHTIAGQQQRNLWTTKTVRVSPVRKGAPRVEPAYVPAKKKKIEQK